MARHLVEHLSPGPRSIEEWTIYLMRRLMRIDRRTGTASALATKFDAKVKLMALEDPDSERLWDTLATLADNLHGRNPETSEESS